MLLISTNRTHSQRVMSGTWQWRETYDCTRKLMIASPAS